MGKYRFGQEISAEPPPLIGSGTHAMRIGPYENEFQRLAGAVVLFSFSLEQTKVAALAVVSRWATSLGAMRIEWVVGQRQTG